MVASTKQTGMFEILSFDLVAVVPGLHEYHGAFPVAAQRMTPLRPRLAQSDLLIANARGTAVRPLIVSCYTATRRSWSHHEQLGPIRCCCMVQKLVSSGWTFRETGHRRNDLLGARACETAKTPTLRECECVETRVPLRR